MENKRIYKLQGKVQHYQWGGDSFLPQLLHIANSDQQPFAEYWLGAHDNAPSEISMHEGKKLNEYIARHPSVLGQTVYDQFGRLPYLLKVLDVKDMLSIQVHPSKESAGFEFEKENLSGIPLTASHRNYKDDNHKPELMVALGDFYLLHGFKPHDQLKQTVSTIPEFSTMLPLFEESNYRQLYAYCMEMDQQEVNTVLQPVLERIIPAYKQNSLSKEDPRFWAARAALTFNEPEKTDRGIFSIYLLNLVHLKEGEAIFQDAGVLHAYLEGQNMEIMANSDNVLRGGLTPKHIDVEELMKHIRFQATTPHVIHGTTKNGHEETYQSPAPDFELSKFSLQTKEAVSFYSPTTEIYMVMKGNVQLSNGNDSVLSMQKGEAAVAFAGAQVHIQATDESIVFRASVPV